jgi:hypothetical protein
MSSNTSKCSAMSLSQAPLQDVEVALSAIGTFSHNKFCMFPPKDSHNMDTPGTCLLNTNPQKMKEMLLGPAGPPNGMVVCRDETKKGTTGRICGLAIDQSQVQTVCTRMGGTM